MKSVCSTPGVLEHVNDVEHERTRILSESLVTRRQ